MRTLRRMCGLEVPEAEENDDDADDDEVRAIRLGGA
jgi:hypothetical protein